MSKERRVTPFEDVEIHKRMEECNISSEYFDYIRYLHRYGVKHELDLLEANQHALCKAKAEECGVDPTSSETYKTLWRFEYGRVIV